jgi:sortase A
MTMKDQMEPTPRRRGSVLIGVGVIFVAAALALLAYNLWDAYRGGQEASGIVSQLPEATQEAATSWDKDAEMPTEAIDGYDYIGTIAIPSVNLKLPVMAEWDYTRLKVSPCRYTGSYWADDMVVCGHAYYSTFGPIANCVPGDDVYFTNVEGLCIHYKVSNVEVLQGTDVEKMVENDKNSETAADWDLSLFTCTISGQARNTVRCVRVSGPNK